MKIAAQMDLFSNLDISNDTTVSLLQEALNRDYQVWHYTVNDLYIEDSIVKAKSNKVAIDNKGDIYLCAQETIKLSEMNVVLMRQNPPMDMNYITATYLLERLSSNTIVVNNPTEVRNAPEKLFVFNYNKFIPASIVTNNSEIASSFFLQHHDIVIKPLYAFGGKDVRRMNIRNCSVDNFKTTFDNIRNSHETFLVLQKFLPEVYEGDKRVVIINGKIAGAINRLPSEGDIRANMCIGGKPEKIRLTETQEKICNNIAIDLKKKGILFAGIDLIGDYLTEINVTSPTGLQTINDLYCLKDSNKLEYRFWQEILYIHNSLQEEK